MRRERISALPFEALMELAETYGLLTDDVRGESRNQLEDALYEVLEEVRQERTRTNTFPVALQDQRYSALDDFSAFADPEQLPDLPDRYNVTRIELILRDPAWAFTYWGVSDNDRKRLVREHGFRRLVLRLLRWPDSVGSAERPNTVQALGDERVDIPVGLDDSRWYINLPSRKSVYRVQLVADFIEGERLLAQSFEIVVPLGALTRELDIVQSFEVDAIIALSGVENLGVAQVGERIPQRILDLIEHEFAE